MSRFAALLAVLALVVGLAPTAAAHRTEPSGAAAGTGAGQASEVLIKLNTGGGPLGGLLGLGGLGGVDVDDLPGVHDVIGVIDALDVHVAKVAPGTAERAAATLQTLPVVDFAEPNDAWPLLQQPNDSRLGGQFALERIDAVDGWARYRDARGYGNAFPATAGSTIAVVDSGLDVALHEEFNGKVSECGQWLLQLGIELLPVCQDNNVHGTHVTGIAAATADNGVGIAGVGFDTSIMALQACTVTCGFADVTAATVFAVENGADVINYSFGGMQESQALAEAIEFAAANDVLMVAAAGNTGTANSVTFPATDPRVMAVSATDRDDDLAPFSSFGPEVDVAAPGMNVLSTVPTGLVYGELSGTSFAAPHVTGLGALLMALGADAEQARAAIVDGAEDIGLPADQQGAGRINVDDSIRLLTGG